MFELSRSMAGSSAPADWPEGHSDTVKFLSTAAVAGSAAVSAPALRAVGGGTCGR
ncbi:zinc ribbon domain-containing protein [Streptomyces sp. NPDC048484]|uniref:zinc ribbon domain-containing protein n=1 Tax=Streptomyces sp. NPDC048484 TaxID=3155146 RepID=UPI0034240C18